MLTPFLAVPRPCNKTARWLKQQLSQNGLRVLQTFDLHDAHLAVAECPCPHHGTDQCDCQVIILLVYGITAEPATLTLHGHDGQTWVSLADRPSQPIGENSLTAIQRALKIDVSTGI